MGGDVSLHDRRVVTVESQDSSSYLKSLGVNPLWPLFAWFLIYLSAHKSSHDQDILHRDLIYGNTSLFESPQDHIYELLVDLDPTSVSDAVLGKLPKDTVNVPKEQSGRLMTAFQGTVIFMYWASP